MRPIDVSELHAIIPDGAELVKGTRVFDDGGLTGLARQADRLYAEAKGSGPAPYRVSLTFDADAGSVKAKCTCPAATSRDFCKHAAALLVAWARAPDAFAESDGPPPGHARKRAVRRGVTSPIDLMKQGVAHVATLARELAVSGVAVIGADRAPLVETLGQNLRDYKLRRLSARTLDLAQMLSDGAARRGSLRAVPFVELVCDLLLTARKLERHFVSGEPIDDRYVEELVGKTWQKADRKPVAGLDLVEYAYLTRVTSDEFNIRESRFVDLASGAHFSEKQIVPGFLARRTDAKPSRGGAVRVGVRGSIYPGFAPTRLDVADLGEPAPVDHAALTRLVAIAIPDVGAALRALQEHRRDLFAPELMPVAVQVDALFARAGRVQAVDRGGLAVHLPDDGAVEAWLGSALHDARLAVLLGDLGVDGALPTLWPLAAIIEGSLGLELRTLLREGGGAARVPLTTRVSSSLSEGQGAARAAGASSAAIALAEIRDELADAFVAGLTALGPRVAEPVVARLHDLGLDPQAELLQALAERPEAASKLDDFVRLFRVLDIALLRLAGATRVDRGTMEPVPTYESVFVARPWRVLSPPEVAHALAAGTLNRYEAAAHLAHHYAALSVDELSGSIYPTWADGSVSAFVARGFSGKREEGLAAAKRALAGEGGRVARMTALRVLAVIGGIEAESILHEAAAREQDVGLRALAIEAVDAIDRTTLDADAVQRRHASTRRRVADETERLATGTTKDVREDAVRALAELGHRSALPGLRRAFARDASQDVRREAALALALLGDTEIVETMVGVLVRRADKERDAVTAVIALGRLGDVRGLRAVLDALAQGWKPVLVVAALGAMGAVAVGPLLDRIEAEPGIASRRPVRVALGPLSEVLTTAMIERLHARAGTATFAATATLYRELSAMHPECKRVVAEAVGLLVGGGCAGA